MAVHINRVSLISPEDYFSHSAVNVSLLKQLGNPKWVKFYLENPDKDSEEKRAFRVGGALDSVLTQPENFNKEYGVLTEARPSGLMGIFIDNLPLTLHKESPQEDYEEAYQKSGYKTALETVINKLWSIPKNLEYFMGRKRNVGKIIVGLDEYEDLLHAQENIINNDATRRYFLNTNSSEILIHQLGILFEYKGLQCKALIDGILVDKKAKKIHLFDLKTTGKSVYSFARGNYLMYGYYLQGAQYYVALRTLIEEGAEQLRAKYPELPKNLNEYEITPMEFIVSESKTKRSNPAIIFETSHEDLQNALSGFSVNNRKYPGLDELVENYKWHQLTNKWDYTKELYELKGRLPLEIPYDN
jgi:hypothetical protein